MKRKLLRAGIWVIAGKTLAKASDVVSLIVLGRILSPEDFGVAAMAMTVVIVFETVLELPIIQALARRQRFSTGMYHTAFTMALLRAAIIVIAIAALSAPISQLYQDPRVATILVVLSFSAGIRGMASPRLAVLAKNLKYGMFSLIDVIARIGALIAGVTFALATESYWAIILSNVFGSVTYVAVSYLVAPYKPRVSLRHWNEFSDITIWNSAAQALAAINWQLDRIVLAVFIDVDTYGKYVVSTQIADLPRSILVQSLVRPMVSALAASENNSRASLYCRSNEALCLLAAPLLILIATQSESVLLMMLGDQWSGAAEVLKWLALASLISLPTAILPALAMYLDTTRYLSGRLLGELMVKLPSMIVFAYWFGLEGAIAARALGFATALFLSVLAVRSLLGISIWRQLFPLLRIFAAAAGMFAALEILWQFYPLATPLALLLSSAVGWCIYLAVYFGIWLVLTRPTGLESLVWPRMRTGLRSIFKIPLGK